jgi:hypothetical protein
MVDGLAHCAGLFISKSQRGDSLPRDDHNFTAVVVM